MKSVAINMKRQFELKVISLYKKKAKSVRVVSDEWAI